MNLEAPILVLDSGLGGLTVAKALRETLPSEDIVYFGDTARLPYGSKSAQTVTSFVRQIIQYLQPLRPKHVVIACNTASALALQQLQNEFSDLSISGVIDPGTRAAVAAAGSAKEPVIGILATEGTVLSRAYPRSIFRRRMSARIIQRGAPLLAPMIEEGRELNDPLVRLAVQQYLEPLLAKNIDVLLLGCTHYPLIQSVISEVAGPRVTVIDSAQTCAEDVARRLAAAGRLRATREDSSSMRFFVSDNPTRFAKLATRFLGFDVGRPYLVSPDVLHGQAQPALQRAA